MSARAAPAGAEERRDDGEVRERCPVCGADRGPDDPILCRACGEPVLRGGWAP